VPNGLKKFLRVRDLVIANKNLKLGDENFRLYCLPKMRFDTLH